MLWRSLWPSAREGWGGKQTSTGRTACEVCEVCIARNFLPLPLRAFCCVFLSGLQPLRILPAHQDVGSTCGRRSARRLQRWEAKAPLDGMFWTRGWAKCVLAMGGQPHGQGGQPARHWLKQTAASIIPAGCMAFCAFASRSVGWLAGQKRMWTEGPWGPCNRGGLMGVPGKAVRQPEVDLDWLTGAAVGKAPPPRQTPNIVL